MQCGIRREIGICGCSPDADYYGMVVCGGLHGAYSEFRGCLSRGPESGFCVVVVTELRRTAIAPWDAFNVSGVRWSGSSAVCMQRLQDGLKVVTGLGL